MLFADLALARRVEIADAVGAVEFAWTHGRLYSDVGAAAMLVAGGQAVYAGVESPLTQAVGLGLHGPVMDADVDAMEEFYRSRGAPVNIEVCPLADASLLS